jgi:hypothetical protein
LCRVSVGRTKGEAVGTLCRRLCRGKSRACHVEKFVAGGMRRQGIMKVATMTAMDEWRWMNERPFCHWRDAGNGRLENWRFITITISTGRRENRGLMQKKGYEMIKGKKVQIGQVSKEKYEIWSQFEQKQRRGTGFKCGRKVGCDIFQLKEKN